ncbi:MAG: hypothetical protein LBE35_07810 [Clostridiales bacterium]|jgi:hypothetical protein|nr:hypothetical protein [Clostridiales bacterium]
MIEFAKELKKFEPVLEIENFDEDIAESDARDVMELLQYLFASYDTDGGVKNDAY